MQLNYRKIYENYYKTIIPKDFDVHHIDYNHYNNIPENLVALPSEIHSSLHKAYNEFSMSIQNFTLQSICLHDGQLNAHTYFLEKLYEYLSVIQQCVPYMNNRNLGDIVNE